MKPDNIDEIREEYKQDLRKAVKIIEEALELNDVSYFIRINALFSILGATCITMDIPYEEFMEMSEYTYKVITGKREL